jgi:hypothetical protein
MSTFLTSNYKHITLDCKNIANNMWSVDFPDEEIINDLIDNPAKDVEYMVDWIIDNHPNILEIDDLTGEWCIILNNVVCHTGFKKDNYSMFISIINDSTHIIALRLI